MCGNRGAKLAGSWGETKMVVKCNGKQSQLSLRIRTLLLAMRWMVEMLM